jgi:uncharacterized protein involved in exopolysaccharide biosynthesis
MSPRNQGLGSAGRRQAPVEKLLDDDIDLRPYIAALLRSWVWILAASLSAAVVVFVVTSMRPAHYEATALVAVTQPAVVLEFDARALTSGGAPRAYGAYPELALSDSVLLKLREEVPTLAENNGDLSSLRKRLSAVNGDDPSLVRLTAAGPDAAEVADIVNSWAGQFVEQAGAVYGNDEQQQIRFFEAQLAQAETEMSASGQDLVDFQARNRAAIIENQLETLDNSQAAYLAEQRTIAGIRRDLAGLRAQLTAQAAGLPVSAADQLTALFLQIKAFNVSTGEEGAPPIELQLGSPSALSAATVEEQIAFVDNLGTILEARDEAAERRLSAIEPEILTLQQELQQLRAEEELLLQYHNVATETHLILTRKLEETRIAAKQTVGEFRLASRATVPVAPADSFRVRYAFFAGLLVFALATIAVIVREWWRGQQDWARRVTTTPVPESLPSNT